MANQKAIIFLKKDRKLAKIIKQVGPFKIKITKNRFQSLIESIVTQQLSGAAANSIMTKFRKLYNPRFPKPIDVINTTTQSLRKTGLSRMKIMYIKELSKKIEKNELNLRTISILTDEEVITKLTEVKGIGRWTAEMFLIFSLGKLDVLPVGDLGLKKGIQFMFSLDELPKGEEIEKLAQKWRPYRTVATWYLWKSLKKFDTIG
jgi:DNA-3-methyladenine glycosylase II